MPTPPRIAVIVSRYNGTVTDRLLDGAREEFRSRGGNPADLVIIDAPGAFELPFVASRAARRPDIDAVLALGCIVRGETEHDRHIASAVASGLTSVALTCGKPVGFGVLTVQTQEQAIARAGGRKGNKGKEAMGAVMDAIEAGRAASAGQSNRSDAPQRPDKVQGDRRTRAVRRLALQAMYQLDVTPDNDAAERSMASAPGVSDQERSAGLTLAIEAFRRRAQADEAVTAIAPEWPPHRQPAVDRAILRLAHFELAEGRTPPEIVINEAVELAREFSTERSPAFVNAVLDRVARDRGLLPPQPASPLPDPVGG